MSAKQAPRAGVVLIGRNEGQRLVRCLESVSEEARPVVYVDSGSTDASCDEARSRGALVVDLDMSTPFSAARARNEGWAHLLAEHPNLDYVQFVDGDCEVDTQWLALAVELLDARDDVVGVCGYRRERYPERSLYNRICDVEWQAGDAGEVGCVGGDVMVRASGLRQTGGYNAAVIAAEDDEFGIRLRQVTGGKLWRLDAPMTLHDANMMEARQWWQRAKRCGHGYAQVNHLHGAPPERYFEDNLRRTLVWGALVPTAAVALSVPTLGLSLATLGRYPVSAARAALHVRKRGFSWKHSLAWGLSCAAAPVPEALGAAKFYIDRLRARAPEIIEYKTSDDSS